MRDKRTFVQRVLDLLTEIIVRVTLKMICALVGFLIANRVAESYQIAGWLKGVLVLTGAFGTFALLQPLFYRMYPRLKSSDRRRSLRPDPRAMIIAASLAVLLVALGADAWYGVILISLVVFGCIFALFMRFSM
jgi:hypothetical protein